MDLWRPPPDQPPLLAWWRPVLRADAALRDDGHTAGLDLDALALQGRVDRARRPSVWIYRCADGAGELYLDDAGQAYRFTRTPNGPAYGRFSPCRLDAAVARLGLLQPRGSARRPSPEEAGPRTPPTPGPRRRGHLTVIEGGKGHPLAG
jgi:hypothetical protein